MTFTEAILQLTETKKGNYTKDSVHKLISKILISKTTSTRICPNCNGKGQDHSPCAFGGTGDYYTCKICNGSGRI